MVTYCLYDSLSDCRKRKRGIYEENIKKMLPREMER